MSSGQGIEERTRLFSAMNTGTPYKSYIKTILGKAFVHGWDVFTNTPTGFILEGDPRKHDEGSIYHVYSEMEDVFFRKMNKKHFSNGVLIEYVAPQDEKRERTIEEFTDEELKNLINQPFFTLRSALNKTQSEAVLFRFLSLAQELEKSTKVIGEIESRISEVQERSMTSKKEVYPEDSEKEED